MLSIEKGSDAFDHVLSSYWSLYRNLQEQFLDMAFNIEFSEANFGVYSAKFLMLLETVCGEVESITKSLVSLTKESQNLNISRLRYGECWYYIQDKFLFHPQWIFNKDENGKERLTGGKPLEQAKVFFMGVIPVQPFAKFHVVPVTSGYSEHNFKPAKGCSLPYWWDAHNTLKHRRVTIDDFGKIRSNFSEANLGNTLGAFAGMYVLVRVFLENVGCPDDLKSFVDTDRMFKGRHLNLSKC